MKSEQGPFLVLRPPLLLRAEIPFSKQGAGAIWHQQHRREYVRCRNAQAGAETLDVRRGREHEERS